METLVLNINETCEYLRISRVTLWRLRKENRIPCFNIGKRVFFNKAALDEWMLNGGSCDEYVSKDRLC